MAINTATNDGEMQQVAALRESQNKARALNRAGNYEKMAGKAMRATGAAVDTVGRGVRKGGTGMMKAGARLSSSGVGAIAGVPLMAVGGLAAAAGLGTQGVGKAVKGTGRGMEKVGRTAKLRAAVQEKRNAANLLKKAGDNEGSGMISGSAQTATSGLLKVAWLNIIPTFGLTLIWINVHVFLRWVFPSFFCKLGKEWIPKSMSKFAGGSSAMLQIGETMLLVVLDIGFGIMIFGFISIVVKTVETVSNYGNFAAGFLSGMAPGLGLAATLLSN